MFSILLKKIQINYCFELLIYSDANCLFARHFAKLSSNVSILISSLLRASCDSNLSKRFFILECCQLTAMASNIVFVSKRKKVTSLWLSGYQNQEICFIFHIKPSPIFFQSSCNMGRQLRENQNGKNAQSLLQMLWNLWSIARFLNQGHEPLKYSRAYFQMPYVPQLISPLARQYLLL